MGIAYQNPLGYFEPSLPSTIWQEFLQNNSGVTVIPGTAVCLRTDGRFKLAQLDSFQDSDTFGLAAEIIAHGAVGPIQLFKSLTTTRVNWKVVTGSDLIPGSIYYLSNVPGKLTNVVPTSGFLVKVGQAINRESFLIEIDTPIGL